MDEFNFREIHWSCSCGTPAKGITVGVTSRGELCAWWFCLECKKQVMACMRLQKLIEDIPPHPEPTSTGLTEEDKKWLKAMHVMDDSTTEGEGYGSTA